LISNESFQEWFQRRRLAKPFLRWAGGKQPFLARYGAQLPRFHGKYIEPFLGSGAIFFYIQRTQARPTDALLGDANLQLVLTYYALRDEPERVFKELTVLKEEYLDSVDRRVFYEELRAAYNKNLPSVEAAVFIFLNRTCWNGLYRTNRDGHFNVPHGMFKGDPMFPNLPDILNASAALRQAQLRASSWENVVASAVREDFVFLDPPYYSDIIAGDAKYGREVFGLDQRKRLIKALFDLKRRGVQFMLTNSAEPDLIQMYQDAGLHVEHTRVPRFISSDTEKRAAVSEIIVSGKAPLRLA
jgi:DNA adenine methylase